MYNSLIPLLTLALVFDHEQSVSARLSMYFYNETINNTFALYEGVLEILGPTHFPKFDQMNKYQNFFGRNPWSKPIIFRILQYNNFI